MSTIFSRRTADPVAAMLTQLGLTLITVFEGDSRRYRNLAGEWHRVTAWYFAHPQLAFLGKLQLNEYKPGPAREPHSRVLEVSTRLMPGAVPDPFTWHPPLGAFADGEGSVEDGTKPHIVGVLETTKPTPLGALPEIADGLRSLLAACRPLIERDFGPFGLRADYLPPVELPGCEAKFWRSFLGQQRRLGLRDYVRRL